jgi:hypothetical protein
VEIKAQKKITVDGKRMNIDYVIGITPQVYSLSIGGSESLAHLLEVIRGRHNDITIERIELADEELQLTRKVMEVKGKRIQAMTSPLVEILLQYKGKESHGNSKQDTPTN